MIILKSGVPKKRKSYTKSRNRYISNNFKNITNRNILLNEFDISNSFNKMFLEKLSIISNKRRFNALFFSEHKN